MLLDLDEALGSELVRSRKMVVEIEQPRAAAERAGEAVPVRQLGIPVKLSRTPGNHARVPAPALGEHTHEVLAEIGYPPQEIGTLLECGAVASCDDHREQGSGAAFRA